MSLQIKPVTFQILDGETEWHDYVYIEERLQRDGSQLWAVTQRGWVLSKKYGDFEYEMQPSSRTDEFIADTRFASIDEALNAYEIFLNSTGASPSVVVAPPEKK